MARAAIALAPDSMSLTLHPIADVPLYNGDVEERGLPAGVVELNEAVSAADGVIFFTPEYNTSLPAVTKNIIDWLSRPQPRSSARRWPRWPPRPEGERARVYSDTSPTSLTERERTTHVTNHSESEISATSSTNRES